MARPLPEFTAVNAVELDELEKVPVAAYTTCGTITAKPSTATKIHTAFLDMELHLLARPFGRRSGEGGVPSTPLWDEQESISSARERGQVRSEGDQVRRLRHPTQRR